MRLTCEAGGVGEAQHKALVQLLPRSGVMQARKHLLMEDSIPVFRAPACLLTKQTSLDSWQLQDLKTLS